MNATELQSRIEKAQLLPVTSIGDGVYYVGSSDGKIAYRVQISDYDITCTCADFIKNSRNDKEFKCKHILAMLNVSEDDILVTKFLDRNKPKLADCWIMNLKGKDFVLYAGLLDLAHQKGLLKLEVEAIQYPCKENGNTAICRAVATSRLGEVFSDIGDADPSNTNSMIAKHLLRMASTRAKARVLRDFSNIGMTALEELGDFDDVIGHETKPKRSAGKKATVTNIAQPKKKGPVRKKAKADKTVADKETAETPVAEAKESATAKNEERADIQPQMSVAQRKAIINLAQRRGISEEELNRMTNESFKTSFDLLTPADASTLIRQLQQSA